MSRKKKSREVLIVGGGLMGTSCALELARQGMSVTVLEKAIPGAEASSAAAGILGAEAEAHEPGPMLDLCRYSQALYPAWVRDLERTTQVNVGYLEGGCLELFFSKEQATETKKRRAFQVKEKKAQLLSKKDLSALEPELTGAATGALFLPSDARITPADLFRATHNAAEKAGARFRTGAYVRRLLTRDEQGTLATRGVILEDETILEADVVVVAAGSWTSLVEGIPIGRSDVIPARGQIVELACARPPVQRLIFGAGCYLVPRADGRVLVGSTLEFVGFQKGVTAKGVRDLLTSATRLIPSLEEAEVVRTWSNFRPFTKDHLPLLGNTNVKGLILASGHYRTGILLAPATAKLVCALALGKQPALSLAAFDPLRNSRISA
jgi:glycine oxidase